MSEQSPVVGAPERAPERGDDETQLLMRLAELPAEDEGGKRLGEILESLASVTGFPVVLLTLSSPDQHELTVLASVGIAPAAGVPSLPFHGSLSAEAIRSSAPVVHHDLRGRPGVGADSLLDLGVQTALVLPLLSPSGPLGTLVLGRPDRGLPAPAVTRLAGAVAGYLGAHLERLETRRRLREVERLNEDLSRTLREARDELEAFNYTVAHDLRAPLRTMQGFAHILLHDYENALPPEALDYVNRIIASGERAEELTAALLEYGRVSLAACELQPVALGEVVQDVLERLAETIRETEATVTVDDALPVVQGDPVMLDRVVEQLVSNALKFVPEDRTPQVRIRPRTEGVPGIEVVDNGAGIPDDKRDRVFRIFERLTDAGTREGTGIGLAIVRRAMQRLDGRAGVESTPGEGSTFWIELPVPGSNDS